MNSTSFGDRMKLYERTEAGRRFMPQLPVCARIDGKNFSTFTRGMERPFDARLSETMVEVTEHLVAKTNACMGYTQSDEISLVWYSRDPKSQIYFDGRIQKMVSVLAAMTTVRFNRLLVDRFPDKVSAEPVFDCRAWAVPTLAEAANTLLWRERDASKNSISMAASSCYSHKELQNRSGDEMQEMLFQKGINWNDYPPFFKRGTFVQKHSVEREFTAEELECLPAKHAARTNPGLTVERSEIRRLQMPPFGRVTNRVAVVFDGATPQTE